RVRQGLPAEACERVRDYRGGLFRRQARKYEKAGGKEDWGRLSNRESQGLHRFHRFHRFRKSRGVMTTPSPLVPMNTGELLDRTFSLYRNNFLLFAGIMLFPSLFMFAAGLFTTLAGKNPILAGVGALVSVYAFVIAW